ncbi:MAG: LEA type 2 family protein [Chitinophagaceae bacterium]
MNTANHIYRPSSVFLALLLLTSCTPVKEPGFREIENTQVTSFGLAGSTLAFDLHYFNPNNFRVKLKDAEGDIWIDKQLLGHFTIDTLIHIPPLADFRLPVELKASMAQLLKNSLAALLNKEVVITVEGRAQIGKGFIYIHYPIHYEGMQKLGTLLK